MWQALFKALGNIPVEDKKRQCRSKAELPPFPRLPEVIPSTCILIAMACSSQLIHPFKVQSGSCFIPSSRSSAEMNWPRSPEKMAHGAALSLILPVEITQVTLLIHSGVSACLCCESLKILEFQLWNVSHSPGEVERSAERICSELSEHLPFHGYRYSLDAGSGPAMLREMQGCSGLMAQLSFSYTRKGFICPL